MKKPFLTGLLWVFIVVWGFAQNSFPRGEELFLQDNPKEAIDYLQNAIIENPNNVKAFLYLGIAYEQTDRIDEAASVYRDILDRAGEFTVNVANNLGNVYFKQNSLSDAETMYTQAIEADRTYAPAYLGRANARLQLQSFRDAVSDYGQYLLLEPGSRQRDMIEKLAVYLRTEILKDEEAALVEAEWVAAEEAAMIEAERLAEEALAEAALAEAERLAAEEAALVEAEWLAAEEAAEAAARAGANKSLTEEEAARVEAEWLAAEADKPPAGEEASAETALAETAAAETEQQLPTAESALAEAERRVVELEEALAEALLADARRRRQAAGEAVPAAEAALVVEDENAEAHEEEADL